MELFKKAIVIQEQTLGKEHPDIATSYNSLAQLHYAQVYQLILWLSISPPCALVNSIAHTGVLGTRMGREMRRLQFLCWRRQSRL